MKEYNPMIKDFIDNIIRYSKESTNISNKMQKFDPSEKKFTDNAKRILKQVENSKKEFARDLLIEINKLQMVDYYKVVKMFNRNSKKSKFRHIISIALNGNLEKIKQKVASDKLLGSLPMNYNSQIDDSQLIELDYYGANNNANN